MYVRSTRVPGTPVQVGPCFLKKIKYRFILLFSLLLDYYYRTVVYYMYCTRVLVVLGTR